MNKNVASPHDRFFKSTMTDLKTAKDYFRNFLPPEIVKKLQLSQLRLEETNYITDALAELFSDIVYSCPYGEGEDETEIFITLLLEHKSYVPPYPHFQLLKYMCAIWDKCIANKQPLRIVLPLIFYHGKENWVIKPFSDYFKGMDNALKKHVPTFEYLITDLQQKSDSEILALNVQFLRNVLLAFKHGKDGDYVFDNANLVFFIPEGEAAWGTYMRNFFHTLFVYLINVSKLTEPQIKQLVTDLPSPVKNAVMSTYEQILQKGMEKGERKTLEKNIVSLYKKDFSLETIADGLSIEKDFVIEVLKKHKLL